MDYKDYFDEFPDTEALEDYVENVVFENYNDRLGLVQDYARAFLSNVNYYEILEHIRENYEHDKATEDEV
jgi:hypothetical protein